MNHNTEMNRSILDEFHKAEHIFNELGRAYQFGISEESNLPMLATSPDDSVGVFTSFARDPLPNIMEELARLEALPMLQADDLQTAEVLAHGIRSFALLVASPTDRAALFGRANALYRSILVACPHPSLLAVIDDARTMSRKFVVVSPVPDMLSIPAVIRRLVAHCLAGMALCALMGQSNPSLCFGFASAAVSWEPERPLELASLLRIQVLLTGMFHLGLIQRRPDGQFVVIGGQELQALQGSPLLRIPAVYMAMTKMIVLPAVMRHGTATMLQREREIVPEEQWEEVRFT